MSNFKGLRKWSSLKFPPLFGEMEIILLRGTHRGLPGMSFRSWGWDSLLRLGMHRSGLEVVAQIISRPDSPGFQDGLWCINSIIDGFYVVQSNLSVHVEPEVFESWWPGPAMRMAMFFSHHWLGLVDTSGRAFYHHWAFTCRRLRYWLTRSIFPSFYVLRN